jgi:hypothetical protein
MVDKVYFLLDIRDGNAERAVEILRQQRGVATADALEGRSSIIALVEAQDRLRLAQLTVQALASVEMMTENLSLLPVRAGPIEQTPRKKKRLEEVRNGNIR